MRAILTFSASAVLALAPLGPGKAAETPSAAQIIDKLAPTGSPDMTTRGIRLGGQPPATVKPATAASTGGMAKPGVAPPEPPRGEASLSVPFATGSSTISPAASRVLDQLGQALTSPKLSGFKFRVEGHTDTVGAPEINKTLSEQRAASVTDYLAAKFNIDHARLTPVGMGADGLLVATGPNVANSANRRVVVVNLGN